MHRVVGLCLVAALLEMAGLATMLHTHEYADHDHPEHHQGLAAHEHREHGSTKPERHDHDQLGWSACDPGVHRTQVQFVSSQPSVVFAFVAETSLPFSPVSDIERATWVVDVDVRVHGPPPLVQASPRAPPVIEPSIT